MRRMVKDDTGGKDKRLNSYVSHGSSISSMLSTVCGGVLTLYDDDMPMWKSPLGSALEKARFSPASAANGPLAFNLPGVLQAKAVKVQ